VPSADGRNERFAALVEDSRPRILRTFARRVTEAYGLASEDRDFFDQAMTTGGDVISDVVRSVRVAEVRIDDSHAPDAWGITRMVKKECLSPADGFAIAVMLLDSLLTALTAFVAANEELIPCFTVAVTALNESISRRMWAVAGTCATATLDRVHRAQEEERRRIARELHDRVGEALSVGLRRLDLLEIGGADLPGQTAVARETVVEAMRRLRVVTSDLREPPVSSLGKALLGNLDFVRAETEVRLHLSGDEAWASPAVLDEVFLILREAVRNALTHGAPGLVLIGVELSSHELSAWVIDDGCGFSPLQATGHAGLGTGLASMRERAALVGGRIMVSSMLGHGTRVELYVPLPDQEPARDDVGPR
jgi:signal transduction histidine kinase